MFSRVAFSRAPFSRFLGNVAASVAPPPPPPPPPLAPAPSPTPAPTIIRGGPDEWAFWGDDYRPLLSRDRKQLDDAAESREERLHEIRKALGIPTRRVLEEIEDKARTEREHQAARREEIARRDIERSIDAALAAIARADAEAARLEEKAIQLVADFVDRLRQKIEEEDEELLAIIAAWL